MTTTLTRYKNPLFETDKGGGTHKCSPTATELLELDIEKFDKSPTRRLLTHSYKSNIESNNDSKQNTPQLKMPKIKDINVELSRTRLQPSTSYGPMSPDEELDIGL